MPFNLSAGIVGLISSAVCLVSALLIELHSAKEVGLLPDPPIVVLVGVVLYAIGANVCNMAGWIVESVYFLVSHRADPYFGPDTFFFGTTFALLPTLTPSVVLVGVMLLGLSQA